MSAEAWAIERPGVLASDLRVDHASHGPNPFSGRSRSLTLTVRMEGEAIKGAKYNYRDAPPEHVANVAEIQRVP